ncbi:MAG: OB-fold nucleic acid binding domain-containing protein [Actinomycetota bacterium]|nr:OB-fold nucleic acid binding domain-containing protein [Actinomycetota bacterium]
MAFKRLFRQLRTPVAELDLDRLREFCTSLPGVTRIGDAKAREDVNVVGEIGTLRIVPRAGSPSLEATISDGSGALVAVWTGRRTIAGISPGKRLVISGRGSPVGPGGRLLILNPRYELL